MMVPRMDSVAALYALQNSMMLTPCGPRAVPTGGAGVAAAAFKAILTSAATFFFLGGILFLDPLRGRLGISSNLLDLREGQIDRGLATQDLHQRLKPLVIH